LFSRNERGLLIMIDVSGKIEKLFNKLYDEENNIKVKPLSIIIFIFFCFLLFFFHWIGVFSSLEGRLSDSFLFNFVFISFGLFISIYVALIGFFQSIVGRINNYILYFKGLGDASSYKHALSILGKDIVNKNNLNIYDFPDKDIREFSAKRIISILEDLSEDIGNIFDILNYYFKFFLKVLLLGLIVVIFAIFFGNAFLSSWVVLSIKFIYFAYFLFSFIFSIWQFIKHSDIYVKFLYIKTVKKD